MSDSTFVRNLREMAFARGWTTTELATRSGIHKNTLNNYIHHGNEPAIRNLRKLRDALGCTWDDLLEEH